jgi:hypothetical protein
MRRSLHTRIAELEEIHQQAIRARDCSTEGESAIEKIRQYLSDRGIEQAGTESLAETFARALGIAPGELKAHLEDAAFRQSGVALTTRTRGEDSHGSE